MYKIGLLSIFFLLFSINSNAQHLIKGQVIDKETGLPMGDVNIRIVNSTKGTTTDSLGRFELNSEKKKLEVKASHISYEDKIIEIKVKNNPNVIELKRGVFLIDPPLIIGYGEKSSPSSYREYNKYEYEKVYQEREKSIKEGGDLEGMKEAVVVEQSPNFLGGIENLNAFFASNFKFPKEAIEANKEGRIFLQFQIDEEGNGVNPEIVAKDLDYGIGLEVLRIFKLMPKWLPATQRENYVKINLVLPVVYSTKGIKSQ